MIIIDVTFDILRKLRIETHNRFFYMNFKESIEIYTPFNNMLFRFTYHKKGDENDLLFLDNELKNSIQVLGISNVNEPAWNAWALKIVELLERIESK